jgi:formamidopyrimidine-DNA glycosylase
MPEGPEISYLVSNVLNNCINNNLKNINILYGRYKKKLPENYNKFKKLLPLKCINVYKKGKIIFIEFSNGWYIISRLGMTGWWYFEDDKSNWHSIYYKNIIFEFNKKLIYTDIRNFGTLIFTNNIIYINNIINILAPDILDKSIKFINIYNRIKILYDKIKNKLIEDVLINQKLIISGIGNYLKSEILYQAKISPLRKISKITQKEWKNIFNISKKISNKMLQLLKNNNMKLYFNNMKIYKKKYDKYNNPIIVHKTSQNRSTYYVPKIQI